MAVQRHDPYRSYNFRVGLGGRARATSGFSEVRLPTLLVRPDVADGVGANLADEASAHLVLRRGFTGSRDLQAWWEQERRAKRSAGRVVVVELLDETNRELAASWRFSGCRPVALHYSPLNALESGVVVETIVLSFDDVEIT